LGSGRNATTGVAGEESIKRLVNEAGIARAISGMAKKLPTVTNAAMARAMHFKALRLLSGVIFWGPFVFSFATFYARKRLFMLACFTKQSDKLCAFSTKIKNIYIPT
jgi:hypothetical protein